MQMMLRGTQINYTPNESHLIIIIILSNHYVHTGYHEMRTHRRDSVHVLAVTRAVVLEICSRRRFIFKMSTNRGKGKNNSFSMIFFFRSRA